MARMRRTSMKAGVTVGAMTDIIELGGGGTFREHRLNARTNKGPGNRRPRGPRRAAHGVQGSAGPLVRKYFLARRYAGR